ncbi:Cgi121p [Sporobolomyces salmoneus]|uniref:Cgi121p n=1 Tax=Sporobolomyces salmoneus TaxID=183962 RepID=UPI00316C45AE
MHSRSFPLAFAHSIAHIALFSRVKNSSQLRQRLITASTLPDDSEGDKERQVVDYAFIDAGMITSRLHLLTAVSQALLAQAEDNLKSKTLHSEVIWMLEPGSNISEALKHFGLSATTKDLLLVRIQPETASDTPQEIEEGMKSIVEGEIASLDLLGKLPGGGTNEKSLRKIYKLNGDAALGSLKPETEEYKRIFDELVTSSTALKSVM